MEPILNQAVRAAAQVLPLIGKKLQAVANERKLIKAATSVLVADGAERFVERLNVQQLMKLESFLKSQQFSHLMLQAYVCAATGHKESELLLIREQVYYSLQHEGIFAGADLVQATDVTLDLLLSAVHAVRLSAPDSVDQHHAAILGAQMAAASARNSDLLKRIDSLSDIFRFCTKPRSQCRALHGKLRLPNVVESRAVNYSQLYVQPSLRDKTTGQSVDAGLLVSQRLRCVIVGDPGAGKSTLAAKLVYDVASDKIPSLKGKVSILLVVRDHTSDLISAHETLLHYLVASCKRPYGVVPPPDALEYLLLNGLAVVVIDGVDELGDSHFRVRFAQMVDAFSQLFPLATIVVTSRVVGYQDAPLDKDLFPIAMVESFDAKQVSAYAHAWFRLNESLTAEQQETLYKAFMQESASASDLRANPLMLSLLCVLYVSERFIPRNRPGVYERCAEILFDRWDRSRGIDVIQDFRPYVKPAVQQLAWRLFTDASGQQSLGKSALVEFLATSVLSKRYDTSEEAQQAASDFLEYCAGRAWVLTDVGSTRLEAQYGFVHRTFLEYFAAAQLVKQKPEPAAVWHKLRPYSNNAQWFIVSQLAIQILDRDYQDGGDIALTLILDDAKAASPGEQLSLLTFAARTLDTISPSNDVLKRVVSDVLHGPISISSSSRRFITKPGEFDAVSIDDALTVLLKIRAPENAGRISRAMSALLAELAQDSPASSSVPLVYFFLRKSSGWFATAGSVRHLVEADLETQDNGNIPTAVSDWERLINSPNEDDISEFGYRFLYESTTVCDTRWMSIAEGTLTALWGGDVTPLIRSHVEQQLVNLYRAIAGHVLPAHIQFRSTEWHNLVGRVTVASICDLDPYARGSALLLLTPTLRGLERADFGTTTADRFMRYALARTEFGTLAAIELINEWNLPKEAHHRLIEWFQN
ncbi:NACHT domain-containing protein [Catellatospora aurea]|uniref:NACHT domain-containing protein n=1 Tax=Catellatospora aurea TaxID=1337874 RepID=A0ABW2GQF0_9ACTN